MLQRNGKNTCLKHFLSMSSCLCKMTWIKIMPHHKIIRNFCAECILFFPYKYRRFYIFPSPICLPRFTSHFRIFPSCQDITSRLTYAWCLVLPQWGLLSCKRFLWHWTSILKIISERFMNFTSNAECLTKEQSVLMLDIFSLMQHRNRELNPGLLVVEPRPPSCWARAS